MKFIVNLAILTYCIVGLTKSQDKTPNVGLEEFGNQADDENQGEREFEDENLRVADPTLHKIKQKIHTHIHGHGGHSKIHSHTHSTVHGSGQGLISQGPLIAPIIPGHHLNTQQFGVLNSGLQNIHQGQLINGQNTQFLNTGGQISNHNSNFLNQNAQILNQNSQLLNQNLHNFPNQNTQILNQNSQNFLNQNTQILNQNSHLLNQNLHNYQNQNSQFLNENSQFLNQNSQFLNQNSQSLNQNSQSGFPSRNDAVQIANINGNNNIVSQLSQNPVSTQNSHIFSGRKTLPLLSEDDIRRNAEKSAEIDQDLDNVLTELDMRSYLQNRPEVKTSAYYERAEEKPENVNCLCTNDEVLRASTSEYNLQSPHLIQVPYNDYYQYMRGVSKRSIETEENFNKTLENYRKMIENHRAQIKQNDEKIVADVLEGLVNDFQKNRISNNIKKVKRSSPVEKLIKNPNFKLNVPETLNNIGVITKNAFEDERAPMYHVRNFMGSTKNAVLSAMRIPPQNLIIPSNYEVKNINPEDIEDENAETVGSINQNLVSRGNFDGDDAEKTDYVPNDPYGIVETFTRVGGAIRDSVRSGQNTLSHIGDIAHNARKVFHTTKNTVPRIILPYAKAPVMIRSRSKGDQPILKKSVIITPRVLEIKEPLLGKQKEETDYVKMGNILDALGISKPDKDKLILDKIVVKSYGKPGVKGIYIPPVGDVETPAQNKANEIREKVASSIKMKNEDQNVINHVEITSASKTNDKVMSSRNNFKINEIKHFTKAEEDKIIDEFLHNIFKIDDKQNKKGKSALYFKDNAKNQPGFDLTETEIKNMVREVAGDVIKEESNKIPKKSSKRNKYRKNYLLGKKKRPEFVIRSRFGDDDIEKLEKITVTQSPINENSSKTDEEAIEKIEEYVENDLTTAATPSATNDDYMRKDWKIGNILQFTEEPVHSSRKLLWSPESQENVGLNLPPELMKPFMARVSETAAENIFENETSNHVFEAPNQEIVGTPENSHILCSSNVDDSPVLCGNTQQPHMDRGSETVGESRTSMLVNENLKKPFMGMGNDDTIQQFYDEYNHPGNDAIFTPPDEFSQTFSDD